MKVGCVVVTYSNEAGLFQCLDSLIDQTFILEEIIVVNNGKVIKDINNRYPSVSVVDNEKNLFYAGGLNQGIKMSRSDFILCLNDDVVLEKNFLEEALKGFDKDERIGMVSGKVLSISNNRIIDSTGLFLGRNRKPLERGYQCLDNGEYDREGFVFGVSGAVGLYKREMLEDIACEGDYFDSTYKMFYEDIDLCWRAQRKGWKAYYLPEAVAYHQRGKTTKVNPPALPFLRKYIFSWLDKDLQIFFIRNRYRTILKNDSWKSFLKDSLYIIAYELCLWFYLLVFRRFLIYNIISDLAFIVDSLKKRKVILGQNKNIFKRN
ncbi:MAG: glycosyltransferase family 2 protein [Candidatus Omnitrophica bacterium]|nr:glycosyltransferase family 2 protein [Candidatus Omnitrophota bacterium]